MNNLLAIFGFPGGLEWIVVGMVGLIVFGKRLPEVARSVGRSVVEFKRGLRDVKGEVDTPAKHILPSDVKPAETDVVEPAETESAKSPGSE